MNARSRSEAGNLPWMCLLPENATTRLPPGRHGVLVRVERGSVLVTQQGDLDDHVLGPGDEVLLPRGGLAVAWALSAARLVVAEAVPTLRLIPREAARAA